MDPFVRGFLRSSLVWLGIGVLIGTAMVFWPGLVVYRAAHMHANLLGFVSMMIFGVAYHVIPRFIGRPLHNRRMAGLHLWVANLGLALLVGGWILRGLGVASGVGLLHPGAALGAVSAGMFIYNIWRTLDPAPVPAPPPAPPLTQIQRPPSRSGVPA